VIANPVGPSVPEPWILGSSDFGAQVAAHFGLPYCFAHFITDGSGCAEALDVYRSLYRPSARFPTPIAAVTVWAMAAETEAEAERQFRSRAVWRLGRDRGVYNALPSPEEAAVVLSDADEAKIARIKARALYGTKAKLGAQLRELAAQTQVDEIAVLTTMHDPTARLRSYQLLAEEFALA